MDRHPNDRTTDEHIDASILAAADFICPQIEEAAFHADPGAEYLSLKLSDGRRLLIPREDLSELDNATSAQASEIWLREPRYSIWWPQLDDGLYLPDFLERRWGRLRSDRSRPNQQALAA